ncbi:MAG: hypothetical protein ACI86M_003920 [Saprospiraceae bacterium]|jgi:hypothetical protein
MKNCKNPTYKTELFSRLDILCFIAVIFMTSLSLDASTINPNPANITNDINGDGTINILVIGTNNTIFGSEAFSPDQIAVELESIISDDPTNSLNVNVVAEDIYMSKVVTTGLGGGGTEYEYTYYSHSLAQYYYWPEGQDDRMDNLTGNGDYDWDYVVISADPYIISKTPGYYSLGVNKIAAKVAEGNAQPLLLMMWSNDASSGASIDHFEEFTYRTAEGAKVEIATIPAGLAWDALPEAKKDVDIVHPTPNGAYVTAASIFSHMYGKSASSSNYIYDHELADTAFATVVNEIDQVHYSGTRSFMSPFKSCNITDNTMNYNHTGSSSENGILVGFNWVMNQAAETVQNGGPSPIDFNYGRANTNFEANKRYKVDPALFDHSLGFPMQDHGNHGDVSMLYGIDRRSTSTINDVDLGVARYMIQQSELPYARAIPIRTIYAQIEEAMPGHSAYRDSWHMHRDLDKAVGAYMHTLLTGNCSVGVEPADETSADWDKWMSHKIGYETAWTLMYLEADVPACVEGSWTGVEDTDWENATNWRGDVIPISTSDVFIPSGVPFYPILDQDVLIKTLEVGRNAEIKVLSSFMLEVKLDD